MVRLVRVSPGPRGEKCGAAGRAKERLAGMEVSKNERFELQVGLAEGGADYRTKIVYQSSDRVGNKKKPKKSNFVQMRPVLIFTVGGVRAGNTHGEALTRATGSTKMPRGSRGGAYVVPGEKGADHGEFQGHWPGYRT